MKTPRALLTAVIAIAALLIGVSSAASVTSIRVVTNNFSYDNTNFEEAYRQHGYRDAYLQLGYDGQSLQLTLSDHAAAGSLPKIKVVVPQFRRTYFNGDRVGPSPEHVETPKLSDIREITLTPFGNVYRGFQVIHPKTTLSEIEAAYTKVLSTLGFKVSSRVANSPNGAVLVFENGASQVRATFHRNGGGGVSARVQS